MFFNLNDVVSIGTKNYIVVSVENDMLVLYNTVTGVSFMAAKSLCTKVSSMNDIRNKAIQDASAGILKKYQAPRTIMDVLSSAQWDNSTQALSINSAWAHGVISNMETNKTLNDGIVDEFFSHYDKMTTGSKTYVTIIGKYNGQNMSIKLMLLKNGNKLGVKNVKRIFGDDGIFGNIAKTNTSAKSNIPHNNIKRAVPNDKTRCATA